MGAHPAHPFFQLVIESLQSYDKDWQLPYITVMYSTGPLFLSVIWKKFMATGQNVAGGRVRILMQDEYNRHPWSFFSHHQGSSWHGRDARFIFWLGGHWVAITVAGFLIAGVVGAGMWWLYGRMLVLAHRRVGGDRGRGFRGWVHVGPWRMQNQKEYELLQRHEV